MRLRKSYFTAAAISFAVLVVAAIVALVVLMLIPATPLAQQMKFLSLNNNSPAAYESHYYITEGRSVAMLDFWTTLPVMLIAGVALGLRLGPKASLRETISYGVLTSAIFAALIFLLNWNVTIAVQQANLHALGHGLISEIDLHYILLAAGTIVLWIAFYTAGAIAGLVTRRRLAPPSPPPAGRKAGKRSVASTSS